MPSAVLQITVNSDDVQISNFGTNAFKLTNTGSKNIASVVIDVTGALYPDSAFDPFGQAGDTATKPLTIGTDSGTGVVAPNNSSYIGAGGTAGFKAIQLEFNEAVNGGFESGETVTFSVDMDPTSIAGTNKAKLVGGTNPFWDVGGVSGAELIGSSFTVTFTDGTTATGQLQGASNQGGSQALASQNSPNLKASLAVNGLKAGGVGTYNADGPSVIVDGPAGQTARVVLTKGFIQPVTPYAQFLKDQLDALAQSDFPANNAVEFQTVDVVLTGSPQDISDLFNFSEVQDLDFAGENQLPLGFVASIIDPSNSNLPIGPVTRPIYLEYSTKPSGIDPVNNPGTAPGDYSSATGSVSVDLATGAVGGAAAGDSLTTVADITGSAFADRLKGDNNPNTLSGQAGNDIFHGRGGNDTVDGGDGIDRVIEWSNGSLTLTDTSLVGRGTDTLANIERATLYGGGLGNRLNASAFTLGPVVLDSRGGTDTLIGTASNDFIAGGRDRDRLTGGKGFDTFIYRDLTETGDTITDFTAAQDRFRISAAGFGGSIQAGALSSDLLAFGSTAQDANDRFIYFRRTGDLYFDSDGTGSASQVKIATLENQSFLGVSSFLIV